MGVARIDPSDYPEPSNNQIIVHIQVSSKRWQFANIETTPQFDEELLCSLGLSLIPNDPFLNLDSPGHHLIAQMTCTSTSLSEQPHISTIISLDAKVLTHLKRISHLQASWYDHA
jgi:hypothetical protein